MQKKYVKIVVFILMGVGITISLCLGIRQKTNLGRLMKENVEALTSSEDNPYYPCVRAKGYCSGNGFMIKGIALTTE